MHIGTNMCEQALQGLDCGGAVAAGSPSLGTSLSEGLQIKQSYPLSVLPRSFASSRKKYRGMEEPSMTQVGTSRLLQRSFTEASDRVTIPGGFQETCRCSNEGHGLVGMGVMGQRLDLDLSVFSNLNDSRIL